MTRSGLPRDLGILNMRNEFRTRNEVSLGTWAFGGVRRGILVNQERASQGSWRFQK